MANKYLDLEGLAYLKSKISKAIEDNTERILDEEIVALFESISKLSIGDYTPNIIKDIDSSYEGYDMMVELFGEPVEIVSYLISNGEESPWYSTWDGCYYISTEEMYSNTDYKSIQAVSDPNIDGVSSYEEGYYLTLFRGKNSGNFYDVSNGYPTLIQKDSIFYYITEDNISNVPVKF